MLLGNFWVREQKKKQSSVLWHENYICFLATLKCRLTQWKEREKYRPSLPPVIVKQLREVRQVQNMYYRERTITNVGDEDFRMLLRTMTRDVRNEIYKYRTARWTSFLSTIQGSHDK